MFSLIFNWDIFSLSFFMWNIINFVDSVISCESFFERNIFNSRSSLLNLNAMSFNLGGSGNGFSLNNSISNLGLLDDLRGLDNLRGHWLLDNGCSWLLDNSLDGFLNNLNGLLNDLFYDLLLNNWLLDNFSYNGLLDLLNNSLWLFNNLGNYGLLLNKSWGSHW